MLKNTVIATGGGTPCFFDNMDFIKKNGLSIYIRMSIPELVQRLKKIKKKRPLLKDVPPARLESYIREQIAVREPYYTRADHILDGPVITPQQLAGIAELAGLISPS
jgi:shikimate kinase